MRKCATLRLLAASLLLYGCSLWAQQASPPPGAAAPPAKPQTQSQPETTLRVDVNLVNVFVTVTDEHGAPVGGLAKENFVLREDEHEQKIAVFDKESALPLSIALAIDTSLNRRRPSALRMPSCAQSTPSPSTLSAKSCANPLPDTPRISGASTKASTTSVPALRLRSMMRFIWLRVLSTTA